MGKLGEVKCNHVLVSNVITKETFRKVQLDTIKTVAEYLIHSAGPNGSNTSIMKYCNDSDPTNPNAVVANTVYSKDGKTILRDIKFLDSIENSIVDELYTIAAHLVSVVGDGTTSVIMLASIIFEAFVLKENELGKKPFEIIRDFKEVANTVKDIIASNGRETTLDDVYKIALISTNGNVEVANMIRAAYEEHGLNTHINLGYSNNENTYTKKYEGLTLPMGYLSTSFINNAEKLSCEISNPRVYAFEAPVTTPLMMEYFTKIVNNNILEPAMENKPEDIIPTVILCSTLSVDLVPVVRQLETILSRFDARSMQTSKPPILIVTDVVMDDSFHDLVTLTGNSGKLIRNYINPTELQKHQEEGLAPTLDNIATEWYGSCDQVIATALETRFINPVLMHERKEDGTYVTDEEGNYILSPVYNAVVNDIKAQLESLTKENAKESKVAEVRRRLNQLETTMVDLLIGGISTTDIEATKHLAEDAILNCRSAIKDGFGYGANFEGLRAVKELKSKMQADDRLLYIVDILDGAYTSLLNQLYGTCMSDEEAAKEVVISIEKDMPINLSTLEYDGNVLSSIMTDQAILDSISKIVSVMFTANQAIVTDPRYAQVYKS